MSLRHSAVWRALAREIIGGPERTAREVAAEASMGVEQAWEFWQALGLPRVADDERVFTQRDVAMLRAARELFEREDAEREVLLQITRVSGQSLAHMVAAQVLPVSAEIRDAMRSPSLSDAEATDAVVSATESLLSSIDPFLVYAWRRHLLAAVSQVAGAAVRDVRDEEDLVVGFADLVDFTALSQQLSHREIARTVDRFIHLGYERVAGYGGRVVKTIGDEIMFITRDAEPAARIALELIDACSADALLPEVRVGMASGPTVAWQGDVYGPVVNLASRLVEVARPGTVLVSEDLALLLDGTESLVLREIPRQRLKGIGRLRPRVIRRGATAAG